jgi:tripartite-type tricarboxylate transporter receptor subunit TctC
VCEIITKETSPGNLIITCKKTGKPVTVSNENGMYCEDMCDEDKDIKANKVIKQFLQQIDRYF